MASSIIERNLKELSSSLTKNINYSDLNYRAGDDDVKTPSLSLGKPVLNAYKMWLQSRKTDYIREPDAGGMCYDLFREYPFVEESGPLIEAEIRQKTAMYYPDVNILKLDIKCNMAKRSWEINIVVSDTTTGLVALDEASSMDITWSVDSYYSA